MSDVYCHTPKMGVAETIGVVAATAGLLGVLLKLLDRISDAKSDKKAIVHVLVAQLQFIIQEYGKLNKPMPLAVVELLNRLFEKAQKLLKSVSSGVLLRVVAVIAHGKFDKRIGELRTGITDIGSTLLPPASHQSQYQANPAMFQQNLASASASISAPGQVFVQVTVACPLHHNMNAAQAPVVMQGQNPVQIAPLGYPPAGVVQGQIPFPAATMAFPPAVYPPVLFPAFGSPAYGYAHGYTSK